MKQWSHSQAQKRKEKLAWNVAFDGGVLAIITLIMMAIVIINYNETLLIVTYNLAYILTLVSLIAIVLIIRALGCRDANGVPVQQVDR